MTNNQTLKVWLETTAAIACVVSATTGSASAATLTPGATFSTFLECANDGISLVVGQNPTDAAGWQYAIDTTKAPSKHTIAFEIDKSVLPNNEPEAVPEPDTIAGFVLLGTIVFARRHLKVRV
ncbi:MAG TPA: hypothetical protein DCE56_38935 [Cyanobacteria bacterium UBA8553]|nr:hypothetical protein [Cyanobacteria bacterium UBA8553]HAJ63884.1 hypothetical protein [Cyanobacteria bacterium UBA8543]